LKNINPIDRWGSTPYDDAVRGDYLFCQQLLANAGGLSA